MGNILKLRAHSQKSKICVSPQSSDDVTLGVPSAEHGLSSAGF